MRLLRYHSPSYSRDYSSRAFTLIELLVVISIIGMLSSVVLAGLGGARDKARQGAGLQFSSSLRQAFGLDAEAILILMIIPTSQTP